MSFKKRLATTLLALSTTLPTIVGLASMPIAAADECPRVVITEICYNPAYKENDLGLEKTADVFEYVEICNVSDEPVSMADATLQYSTEGYGGTFGVNRILAVRDTGDRLLGAGEIAVIAVFSGDSHAAGLRYDTEAERMAYYQAFVEHFECSERMAEDRFYIAPSRASATGEKQEGTFNLSNSPEDAVLRLVSGDGATIAEASYNADKWNRNGNSLNMAYRPGVDSEHPLASHPLNEGRCSPGLVRENQTSAEGLTATGHTTPLKVMEYNVCATDSTQTDTDGSAITMNERIQFVYSLIESRAPDVVGLCEINYLWVDRLTREYLVEGSTYAAYGRSSQGSTYGERGYKRETWDLYNLILWNTEKHDLIQSGTFWCSNTPDTPNTYTWDDGTVGDFARAINWVILEEKATGAQFFFLCAHMDAKVTKARNYSAAFITEQALSIADGLPIIMVGDWNTNEKTEAYATITADALSDARYRIADPSAMTLGGTFNSWGKNSNFHRLIPIDLCFVSKNNITVTAATSDPCYMDEAGTLVGSDHNAIFVDLLLALPDSSEPDSTTDTGATTSPDGDSGYGAETTADTSVEDSSTSAGGCSSTVSAAPLLLLLGGALLARRRKDE